MKLNPFSEIIKCRTPPTQRKEGKIKLLRKKPESDLFLPLAAASGNLRGTR